MELIYSFSIKLKKSISKDLMSRDFKFKSLQEIISAAQRYELQSDSLPGKDFEELPAWELTKHAKPEPVAVNSGPIQSRPSPSHVLQQQDFSHSNSSRNVPASGRPRPNQQYSNGSNFQNRSYPPTGIPSGNSGKSSSRPQGTSEICNMFNEFKRSTCELPNNKCFYHRLHKCQACHKWGCKSCKHVSTINELVGKANKAVSMIRRAIWKLGVFEHKALFKIFDSLVVPILCYGSEVWGY